MSAARTSNPEGTAAKSAPSWQPPDFSLLSGGPAFQLVRRLHLSGEQLELLPRRVLAISLFAWLPLLILTVLGGHAFDPTLRIPFLQDVEAYVRFLVALPALIAGEVIISEYMRPVIRRFVEARIISAEDLAKFKRAVDSVIRARESRILEFVLVVLAYTVGVWFWRSKVALGVTTWYSVSHAAHSQLTPAGWWYVFVSIPLFQFSLARWYLRLVLWFRFLWQVSRLNLHLTAVHPDRAGGIGFLGTNSIGFIPLLFAQGVLLSGVLASRILYEGQHLSSFRLDVTGFVILFVVVILGPLAIFTPQLERTKRIGLAEFGLLANRSLFQFEDKWIRGRRARAENLLDSGDVRSLSALASSYSVLQQMRVVPFGLEEITWLAAASVAPLLPLLLTVFSLQELAGELLKIIVK